MEISGILPTMKKPYPSDRKRILKTFKLHPEVVKQLQGLSEDLGISQAKVIEKLIKEFEVLKNE